MSKRALSRSSFAKARRDALTLIGDSRANGDWTETKRAQLMKDIHAQCQRMKHKQQREQASYHAGWISVLKSGRSHDFSEETIGPTIYCPLPLSSRAYCQNACSELASWKCSPQESPTLLMLLCDRCKQEMEREIVAYQFPDGWDWDEDELFWESSALE